MFFSLLLWIFFLHFYIIVKFEICTILKLYEYIFLVNKFWFSNTFKEKRSFYELCEAYFYPINNIYTHLRWICTNNNIWVMRAAFLANFKILITHYLFSYSYLIYKIICGFISGIFEYYFIEMHVIHWCLFFTTWFCDCLSYINGSK